MVRLAVEELIERLDIAAEVLKESDKAGIETLAVLLAKTILTHYVKPFSMSNPAELLKAVTDRDSP